MSEFCENCKEFADRIFELETKIAELKKAKIGPKSEQLLEFAKTAESQGMINIMAMGLIADAIEGKNFDAFDCVSRFHEKFGLEYSDAPRKLPKPLETLKLKHLHEELVEYKEATEKERLVDQLDALVDLVYVALGTAYLHGFDFNEAFRRVHAANMKKTRAVSSKESKRGSRYDVVKPPNWKAPFLKDLV